MPADDRTNVVTRMSQLLGISPQVIDRAEGRLDATLFCRELLRDQRRLCGRYYASITAIDPYPDRVDYEGPDPTLASIDRLFTAAINHQLRSTLQVNTELEYRLLSMEVNQSWKDKSQDHVFRKLVGAIDDLRYGMSLNQYMKVFISHGRFDLITPYFSSRRLINLMRLAPEQRENLVCEEFDGGHMFYSWDDSRAAFHASAQRFYASAVRP
jgi:carboxypeptidase C (cathepsin A)